MTTRPSHAPAGWIVLLAAGIFAATAIGCCLVGCVDTTHLSPVGEQLVLAAARIACPFEAGIPVAGSAVVLACPGEEAALGLALDQVTAHVDAGAPPMPLAHVVAPNGALLRATPAGLVHVGWVRTPDAGSLVPVPAKPPPPPVGPGLDAGAEGGR